MQAKRRKCKRKRSVVCQIEPTFESQEFVAGVGKLFLPETTRPSYSAWITGSCFRLPVRTRLSSCFDSIERSQKCEFLQ